MDIFVFAMRLIHIFSGVFWAGGTFFMVSVIAPTVQLAGPDGAKFMQQLAARGRMSSRFGIASILTVLSGLLLYWRLFALLGEPAFRSGYGIVLAIGAVAGLAAFFHGFFVTRRLSEQAGALAREMMAAKGPPAPQQISQAQALGAKLGRNSVITAGILAVAVLGMATAEAFGF
jgi:uncharacterized membrane protein